ncbi:MAG: glycosyltransferase family 4 protein [Elusimicrobia bacterium]|nr:glycosyltransferase family 4 protein [Elusimicrobiota bacterium]
MSSRVLFLNHCGVLGGAELVLLDVAAHFRHEGEVILFEDGPFRSRLEGVGVQVSVMKAPAALMGVRRGGGFLSGLSAAPGAVSFALEVARRAKSFDMVYANSQKAMVIGSLAALIARKPLVWDLNDIMSSEHFSFFHRRLATGLANTLCDRVIANSQASAQAFKMAGGFAVPVVVYPGIDPGPFLAIDAGKAAAARRELGFPSGPLVGMFGRLAPWKGQHVLLDALDRLPGVQAMFVGEALFGEDEYAERVRARVRDEGLSSRVRFVGFREDVASLMSAVDILVHASISPEPFGRVIVEGMLAAKPVLAARAGGVVEIIADGADGFLFEPGDATALASLIRRLTTDSEAAASVGRRARQSALSRFTRDTMVAAVRREVDSLVGARA